MLIKTRDLSKIFGVSRQAIELWRKAGLPYEGSNKCLRYDLVTVVDWLKTRPKQDAVDIEIKAEAAYPGFRNG